MLLRKDRRVYGGGFVVNREFEIVPNDSPNGIMPDDELTPLLRIGIRLSIEEAKAKGVPIARYDKLLRKAYLEYPDGRREYA